MKKKIFIILIILILIILSFQIFKESSDDWAIDMSDKLPIIYSDNYDITLFGIQKLHPFDSEKYSKVSNYLINNLVLDKSQFYAPEKINNNDLSLVHTQKYQDTLNKSRTLAQISELGLLSIIPNFILQERLLDPIRYGTGGTVLGADLALQYGWAINLSGGYHHTKAGSGSGFGFYADIPIAVNKQWQKNPELKVLIIDLDAHQGNGNEAIFKDDPRVFIFDLYHEDNYPGDNEVKKYIDFNWPVRSLDDQGYLGIINKAIPEAIKEANPQLIIYNAGTDIYSKDPLGKMNVTKQGIIQRDELIFKNAIENNIPILMVLSGGYTAESSEIIGESIVNLYNNYLK